MAVVTICRDFGTQENKVCHCFIVTLPICHAVMGLDAMIFVFWMLSFKPVLSLSSFTFSKRFFSSSSLSAIRCMNLMLKVKVKSESECMWKWKSLSCVQLCDPMDYTVHGILQAKLLEWVTFPFSRGSSQSKDWTQVSRIADRFFNSWATVHIWVYWYFSQQSWSQPVLHRAWHFTWRTLHISWIRRVTCTALMCSFFNLETVHCSMSSSVSFWPAYNFLRWQVRCSGIPISLRIFHGLLWST